MSLDVVNKKKKVNWKINLIKIMFIHKEKN